MTQYAKNVWLKAETSNLLDIARRIHIRKDQSGKYNADTIINAALKEYIHQHGGEQK